MAQVDKSAYRTEQQATALFSGRLAHADGSDGSG
jgi:hypothetical protein